MSEAPRQGRDGRDGSNRAGRLDRLDEEDRRALMLLGAGWSAAEAADALHWSLRVMSQRLAAARRDLGVSSTAAAIDHVLGRDIA